MQTAARLRQALTRKLPNWALLVLVLLLTGPFTFTLLKGLTFSKRKLPHPNPTSYVFHAPIAQVRTGLPQWCESRPCPSMLCLVLYRPSNGTEFDLDQLELTKSDVYHWLGTPLEYKSEYHVFVAPMSDSETRVEVRAVQSQVRIGPSFGFHGGDYYEWVAPTTIEEYRILLLIGERLGEQGMPPLQLPPHH